MQSASSHAWRDDPVVMGAGAVILPATPATAPLRGQDSAEHHLPSLPAALDAASNRHPRSRTPTRTKAACCAWLRCRTPVGSTRSSALLGCTPAASWCCTTARRAKCEQPSRCVAARPERGGRVHMVCVVRAHVHDTELHRTESEHCGISQLFVAAPVCCLLAANCLL